MVESDVERDQFLNRLLEMINREYGRRNVKVDDYCIRIRDHLLNVNVYVYRYTALAYAYLHGEGEFDRFPLDGSVNTLEQLAENTNYGPGVYVNAAHTFYVPNYPFLIKVDDLDKEDFVIRVIDRLVEMADVNSSAFNRAMENKDDDFDTDLFDLDFEEDEAEGTSSDETES